MGDWKKIAGIAGVLTVILFVVSFSMFGSAPSLDAPAGEVREYFADTGDRILFANWLVAVAIAFVFMVFASGLRGLLGSADADDRGLWSRASFAGAVALAALGGAGSVFWGVASLSTETLSDEILVAAHHMDALLFGAAMPMLFALILAPASLVIVRTRVLWAWLGWFGLATALINVIGALWPLEGDNEGFLGLLSFIGLLLTFVWILIAGIGMMRMESSPAES